MKAQRDSRGMALLFFNLDARRGVYDQRHASHHSTPGKEKRYPVYRRMGGPQSLTGRVRNSPTPRPGFDPRIVYPVAKRLYKNVLKNIYLSCLMIKEREEGGGNNEGAVN